MEKNVGNLTFIGRPFPDAMMDAQKTFTEANAQVENDTEFQKFLKDNHLENKRTNMIVFGPENFMYWYGVLTDSEIEVPKSLMKFDLPAAKIDVEEENGQINVFNTPLNFVISTFFKNLSDKGVKVFENPGDSETPYFVQDLDLDNHKLSQIWYLNKK